MKLFFFKSSSPDFTRYWFLFQPQSSHHVVHLFPIRNKYDNECGTHLCTSIRGQLRDGSLGGSPSCAGKRKTKNRVRPKTVCPSPRCVPILLTTSWTRKMKIWFQRNLKRQFVREKDKFLKWKYGRRAQLLSYVSVVSAPRFLCSAIATWHFFRRFFIFYPSSVPHSFIF